MRSAVGSAEIAEHTPATATTFLWHQTLHHGTSTVVNPSRGYALVVALSIAATACQKAPPLWPAALRKRAVAKLALFEQREPITGILRLPFAQLFGQDPRSAKRSAFVELHVTGDAPFSTVLLARPLGRLSRVTCHYPKLELALPHDGPDSRVVLVSHCSDRKTVGDSLPSTDQLYGQYLAYRLLQMLEIPGTRVRLMRIAYQDSQSETSLGDRVALLIEHFDDLARRLSGGTADRMQEHWRHSSDRLDSSALARLHLFAILTNNRDWKIHELQPLSRHLRPDAARRYLHNVAILLRKGQRPLPVPFDFDISSFVGLTSAVEAIAGGADVDHLRRIATEDLLRDTADLTAWMALRLQHLRARHPAQHVRAAIAHFIARRTQLSTLLKRAEASAPARQRAQAHLAAFFAAIELDRSWHTVTRDAPIYTSDTGEKVRCQKLRSGVAVRVASPEGSAGRRRHVTVMQREVIDEHGTPRTACVARSIRSLSGWIASDALSAPHHLDDRR